MKKITLFIFLLAFSFGFSQDPAAGPTDPPARQAIDVVSFYNGIATPMGDDYTNVAGVGFDVFGSAAVIADQALADGNTVKKYTNHNFSGIGGGNYNVGQMETLHIDVYFEPGTNVGDFRVKLEDQTGGATEISVENNPATGQWISYDIPLTSYPGPNLSSLKWIVPVTTGATTNLYFDNIYFFRVPVDPATDASLSALEVDNSALTGFTSGTLDYDFNVPAGTVAIPQITTATTTQAGASAVITQATAIPGSATVMVTASDMMTTQTYTVNIVEVGPSTAAPNPPARDPADVLSVFSGGIYTDVAPSNGTEAFGGDGYDNFTIESMDDTRRITFAAPGDGMQFLYITNGLNLTNFSHVHIDVFVEGPVTAGQVFTLNFINQPGTGDSVLNTSLDIANVVGSGAWYSADIALDDFNGAPMSRDAVTLLQLVGAGPSTYGPLYFDNFYFYNAATASTNDFLLDSVQVSPNPSNNIWNIESSSIAIETVEVYDLLGKRVLNLSPNSQEVRVDASGLRTGIYLAKLTSEGATKTVKLVKN